MAAQGVVGPMRRSSEPCLLAKPASVLSDTSERRRTKSWPNEHANEFRSEQKQLAYPRASQHHVAAKVAKTSTQKLTMAAPLAINYMDTLVERKAAHRARRFLRRVDRVLTQRYQVDYEDQIVMRRHELLNTTATALLASFSNTLESDPAGPGQISEAQRLHLQYVEDYNALQQSMSAMVKMRGDLTTLEFRLKRREEALKDLYLMIADLQLSDTEESSQSASNDSIAPPASDTPSLLDRYYTRKGDAGIFRERLQELDFYHHEGLAQREIMADRGDVLDTSDEDFEAAYKVQRQLILNELNEAEADAQDLARQCEEAGLPVDVRRILTMAEIATTSEYAVYEPDSGDQERLGDLQALGSGDVPTSQKANVRNWLAHLAPAPDPMGAPQTPGSESGYPVTAAPAQLVPRLDPASTVQANENNTDFLAGFQAGLEAARAEFKNYPDQDRSSTSREYMPKEKAHPIDESTTYESVPQT